MAQLFRPVARPAVGLAGAQREAAWLDYARARDPIGDRVHFWLACSCFLSMAWSSTVASIALLTMLGYGLLRAHATWGAFPGLLRRPIVVLLIVFACWSVLSLYWTLDLWLGLRQAQRLRWVFLPVAIWPVIYGCQRFFVCLLLGVLVLNVSQLMEVVQQLSRAGVTTRTGGVLSQPTMASLWCAAAIVGWSAMFILEGRRMATLAGVGVLFALIGLGAGGGRAALLAAIIGVAALGVLCWLKMPELRKRVMWCVTLGLVFAIGLAPVLAGPLTHEFAKLQRGLIAIHETGNTAELHMTRLIWAERGLAYWAASPLTGRGLGSYRTLSLHDETLKEKSARSKHNAGMGRSAYHPHSVYVSSLVETGLIGFGLLLSMLSLACVACWRAARRCDWSLALAPMLLVWLLAGVFDSLLYIGHATSLFAAIVTLSLQPPAEATTVQSDLQAPTR